MNAQVKNIVKMIIQKCQLNCDAKTLLKNVINIRIKNL